MNIKAIREGGILIFTLGGKFDAVGTPHIKKFVEEELKSGDDKILFDIAGIEYVSSTGIKYLLDLNKKIAAQNGKFAIANPSSFVTDLFDISGLNSVIEVSTDLKDASNYLNLV